MHIVMDACAPSRGKWQHPRRKVAVVQLTQEYTAKNWRPKMISDRARGVLRIIATWNNLYVGKTDKCEYAVRLKAAEELAARLNAAGDVAEKEQLITAGSA